MSLRPTILLVIPNLGRGGAQQVFRQQFESLARNFNVYGCVFNWDGTTPEEWPSNITSLNVKAGRNFIEKFCLFIKRIYRLRKLKSKLTIEIAISHLEGADYVNILSSRTEKIILWIHGTKEHDANISGLMGWLRKSILMPWLYKKASRIVTVSEGISYELMNTYPNIPIKPHVIRNGIDRHNIQKAAYENIEPEFMLLSTKFKIIITHCRLATQKNLHAFISITNTVKDDQVKWVIIGDGELREDLLNLSIEMGISTYSIWSDEPWDETKKLFFLGYKLNPYAYLKRAHLFLMTSLWEGFPLAICEAMACGLPIAAADCPTGPHEILAPTSIGETMVSEIKDYGILLPMLTSSNIEEVGNYLHLVLKNDLALQKLAALSLHRSGDFSSSTFFNLQENLINSLL